MKLIIDNASLKDIKSLYANFPIDGVTTNPSILAKEKRNPYEVLTEIREFIGSDSELHVQVLSSTAEEIIQEAVVIREKLGKNTFVKVPVTREGLKAIKELKKQGVNVTATAIYTHMQAFLAAKAGADYTAPYINRIDNLGYNGIQTALEIHDIIVANGLKTHVLAASFKNSQQVLELAKHGVGAATVAPDVIEGLIKNATVADAIAGFVKDFEGLCGVGKTMKDI